MTTTTNKVQEYIDRILYSEKYADDEYEYRHVILPKPLLKMVPKSYFEDPKHPEVLRLLTEEEWRGIGITQSLGWEHYEIHAPEPHVLLFRRPKDPAAAVSNGKNPAQAAKIK